MHKPKHFLDLFLDMFCTRSNWLVCFYDELLVCVCVWVFLTKGEWISHMYVFTLTRTVGCWIWNTTNHLTSNSHTFRAECLYLVFTLFVNWRMFKKNVLIRIQLLIRFCPPRKRDFFLQNWSWRISLQKQNALSFQASKNYPHIFE